MRICDLRQKEVINITNCRRLGFVCDVDFSCETGRIEALIVPGPGKICGIFGRDTEYVILFGRVCQIGPDIILVDIKEDEVLVSCRGQEKRPTSG